MSKRKRVFRASRKTWPCENCRHLVHVPDERTGLIHVNGLYVCKNNADVAR